MYSEHFLNNEMEHYHNDINMNICRDGKMDHSCSMGWEKMNYSYSNFSFTQELMAPCSHPKVYEHGKLNLIAHFVDM